MTEVREISAPSAKTAVMEALKRTDNAAQVMGISVSPYFYSALLSDATTYARTLPTGELLVITSNLKVAVDETLPDYHFRFEYIEETSSEPTPPLQEPGYTRIVR